MITCFKLLTQATIERVRASVYSLSETQQTQLILNYLVEHSQGHRSVLYTIGGQEVCETFFRKVHGFRYNRFSSIKKKFQDRVRVAEHGRLGRRETSDGSVRVISWLCIFFDKVGDRMPMSAAIHLPSCLTKLDVYSIAYDDLSQGGMQCCKLSTFYDIWQKHFPSVKIPKVIRIVYS